MMESRITDQQIIDGLRCTRNPNAPDGADCENCPWISVHEYDEYDGDEWTTCDVWRLQSAAAERLEALSKGLHGIMAQLKKEQQRTVTAEPEQVYIGRRLGHAQ